MGRITTIFSDVGGVLLTNGWDSDSRREAVRKFGLDGADFERRHHEAVADFETGRILTDEYLRRTVFHQPRPFAPDDFKEFMRAQSRELPGALAVMEDFARTSRYLMGTLNNESLDLNLYRIERFGLRRIFTFFFSSSFVGAKKPEEPIYRIALRVTQRPPDECLFIDDRPENLDAPRRLGFQTLQCRDADQLRQDLRALGVE